MDIILYNITDPPNKVNKTLSGQHVVENVRFKEENALNVINPTILLNLSEEISDVTKYNYLYIGKFARYYYITNISTRGGLAEIETKVDPLKSFQNDILNSSQVVTRCESKKYRNKYLQDDVVPFDVRDQYDYKKFQNKVFDTNCVHVILETIGKGGTPA